MGAPAADLPGFEGSLALSLLYLSAVCVAAYVMLRWFARRGAGRSDACIRIVGRCSLEPRRSVYLIEVGGRCFLVGVGDGAMSLLSEIDRTTLPVEYQRAERPMSSFAEVLSKVLRKGRR